MDKLLDMLKSVRADIDFSKETALIDDGLLDSVDVLSIVAKLKECFGVEVSIAELDPDDFNSVATIQKLIDRKANGR